MLTLDLLLSAFNIGWYRILVHFRLDFIMEESTMWDLYFHIIICNIGNLKEHEQIGEQMIKAFTGGLMVTLCILMDLPMHIDTIVWDSMA